MLNFVRRRLVDDTIVAVRRFKSIVTDPVVPNITVENEPLLDYKRGSEERMKLESALKRMQEKVTDVPIVIGNHQIYEGKPRTQCMPHNHQQTLANYFHAPPHIIKMAIQTAVKAQKKWEREPFEIKAKIWDRAASLMANEYRMELNAATMLGQSKTVIQAEIDAAAELIDFFRFNTKFAWEIQKYQPISVEPSITKNSMRYRGLEGFVASISPFNFTAIGGNLAFTPALMGNAVVWKPSDTAVLSNYLIFQIMTESGLPPGVVNFVPAGGPDFGQAITSSADLSAINFTGSVRTFNWLWRRVAENIDTYKTYPRLIGECGGKNFHLIHHSADVSTAAVSTVRSAFEYCGQKCSACSRLFVAESVWDQVKDILCSVTRELTYGDPTDFKNFMGAVIDEAAFARISKAIRLAVKHDKMEILIGGKCDNTMGYFIEPTIIQTLDPFDEIMRTELFGPVLSVYVFKDKEIDQIMDAINISTPYALTGAVFAQDREFLSHATEKLKMSAGNFYINDKSTGSVVGQQPFGGARKSGTNDKAGGPHYVLRFASPQSVKETFVPQTEWKYPYMM